VDVDDRDSEDQSFIVRVEEVVELRDRGYVENKNGNNKI
jgi:hypothetical protein